MKSKMAGSLAAVTVCAVSGLVLSSVPLKAESTGDTQKEEKARTAELRQIVVSQQAQITQLKKTVMTLQQSLTQSRRREIEMRARLARAMSKNKKSQAGEKPVGKR